MKNYCFVAGTLLLAATAGLSAFSNFEIAPKHAYPSNSHHCRTLPGNQNTLFSEAPLGNKNKKDIKAASSGPVIYGMLQYSDDWINLPEGESYPYGCYRVTKSNPIPFEMYAHPNLRANGGGCYTDHQVHYRIYELLTDEPWFNNYYMVVNTDYWSYVQNPILSNKQESISSDMTYDPISKNIYAAAWSNFDGGNNKLAVVNPVSGETSEIATIPDMACLVADNFGTLYGVELHTGTTYQFDKTTGEYVALGQSGLNPQYMQSACIDPETNTVYWAATLENETSGIYTLNTTTGKADLYVDLPNNDEFTCLFIEAPTRGLNAPARVNNFSVAASQEGSKISFTAPSVAFDGSALSEVTVNVYADGLQIYSKNLTPGQEDSFTCQLGEGHHPIVAFASNNIGEGPKSVIDHFTGNDAPAAPEDITLEVNGNMAVLSWKAPVAGIHGGTIDSENLAYNIVRYPGAEIVAENYKETTFSEELPEGMANYYYSVTSVIGDLIGGSAISNSWFAGEAFDIPYTQPFDNPDAMLGFTVMDIDGDGYAWDYTDHWKAVWSRFNKYEQSDNWLITPPLKFKGAASYKISFRACAFDEESPERFEVLLGKTPNPEGMTSVLIPATITKDTKFKTYTANFTADADGVAYIGFHAISPADSYRLIIDDIEVRLTAAAGVPAAVENLIAVPAEDGSASVKLSFKSPAKTQDGAALNKLNSIEIFRNSDNNPVKTINNPAVNSIFEWTDPDAGQGENIYRVCAINEAGRGPEASVSAFVGFDKPLPASDLSVSYNDDKSITVSWKAPSATVSGNKINDSYLKYDVRRSDNVKVAEGISQTSFTDNSFKDATEQKMIYYQVEAYYGDFKGEPVIGDYVLIGESLQIPFAESFADKGLQNTPWVISRLSGQTSSRWSLQSNAVTPDATAQDNDGGFASFVSYDQPAGIKERLSSPKIDLFSADHPVLKFYLFMTTAQANETLEVQISDNDQVFHSLGTYGIKGETDGWKEIAIDIPRKYCTEQAIISFLGTTARGFNIHIDNIRILNGDSSLPDYDLEAVSLDVPALEPDKEATLTLTVYNNGSQRIDNYDVQLLVDGVPAISTSANKTIEPGETYLYMFRLTPEQSDLGESFRFKGRVICDKDMNPENNETDEISATVNVSGLRDIIAEDSSVSVFSIDGQCVAKEIPACEIKNLAPGVYIIYTEKGAYKLVK